MPVTRNCRETTHWPISICILHENGKKKRHISKGRLKIPRLFSSSPSSVKQEFSSNLASAVYFDFTSGISAAALPWHTPTAIPKPRSHSPERLPAALLPPVLQRFPVYSLHFSTIFFSPIFLLFVQLHLDAFDFIDLVCFFFFLWSSCDLLKS